MRTLIQRSTSSGYLAALVLSSTVLISGCSGQSAQPQGPAVASIASVPRADTPNKPADTNAAERPLIRMDTSPEEVDRMVNAWLKCLSDHGVPSKAEQLKSNDTREYPAATAACAAKEPEDYQEREKRENPAAFQDHQREQIKCMKEHGLAIETGPEGWGYTNPARDMGSVWDEKCEKQAFGGS